MTGCTVIRYEQFETSLKTIEQELRPAVCKHRQTDKENYSIDYNYIFINFLFTLIFLMFLMDVHLFQFYSL